MAHKESTSSLLRTLELLDHCCKHPYGFAIALENRALLDWLDGYCTSKLRSEMQKKPEVFERLCLECNRDVLATREGKEFSETDCVNCFIIVRSLVSRMDELGQSEIETYHSQLVQERNELLERAIAAIRAGKPYMEQVEWSEDSSLVKCGRCSAPEGLRYKGGAVNVIAVSPSPINEMVDYDVSGTKQNENSGTPSEEEINGMIAQAREVLGSVNETQFRSLLKQYKYNLDQAIGATFA